MLEEPLASSQKGLSSYPEGAQKLGKGVKRSRLKRDEAKDIETNGKGMDDTSLLDLRCRLIVSRIPS